MKNCNYLDWQAGKCSNLEYFKANYGGVVSEHYISFKHKRKNVKMTRCPLYLIKTKGKDSYGSPYVEYKIYELHHDGPIIKRKIFDMSSITNKDLWEDFIMGEGILDEYIEYLKDTLYYEYFQ